MCYGPAITAGFVWDDDKMLTNNVFVKLPLGLYYIWCSTALPDYYPLTSTSFWLEWRLWGLNATGYHFTNILLHGANAFLVWKVLRALNIPGAWLAGLIFAIHPVNVQSVAWIAERKNTLCMCFFLLSVLSYLHYESMQAQREGSDLQGTPTGSKATLFPRDRFYWLSLAAFLGALLSKAAVVMLPFILLLCIAWRRRPTFRDVVRMVPFFGLACILGLVTIWFQHHRAIAGEEIRTDHFAARVAGAGKAFWFYAGKLAVPSQLCFVYPRWSIDSRAFASWMPLAAVLLAFGLFSILRPTFRRPLLLAFGCFGLLLLPVLGLINIYFQRYSLVGDQWAYFADIGLIALIVGTGSHLFLHYRDKPLAWVLPMAAAGVIVCLGLATMRQAQVYHDAGTLWEDTLAKNPGCWLAHNSLGSALADAGNLEEARFHFEQGLAIKPDSVELLNNLATVLNDEHKPEQALTLLRKALEIAPGSAMAYYNLGNAYDQLGKAGEAEAHYRRALEFDPAHAAAHSNLGCLLYASGKRQEAIEEFERAVSAKPDYAEALNNLGAIFLELGRAPEAESLLRDALRFNPAYTDAAFNLGNALLAQGKAPMAASAYRRVLVLNPAHALARCRLGVALWQQGDTASALAELNAVLQAAPDLADAHYYLGLVLQKEKKTVESVNHLRRATELKPDWPDALAGLAVALATAPGENGGHRDEALRAAERATELTGKTNYVALDSLATAYAASGKYDQAAVLASTAAKLARAARDSRRADQIEARAELFAAGKPYHE